MNVFFGNSIFFYAGRNFFYRVGKLKIKAGKINRNRNARIIRIIRFFYVPADTFHHTHIKLVNLMIFFEDWNKFRRRQKSVFRVIPAGKSLCPAKLSVFCKHNRLVVNKDIAVFYCGVDCIDYVLLALELRIHIRAVLGKIPAVMLFNGSTGIAGMIQGNAGRNIRICSLIYSAFKSQAD